VPDLVSEAADALGWPVEAAREWGGAAVKFKPTAEVYDAAMSALDDWTFKQTDHNALWENTNESSRAVVDAVWPLMVRAYRAARRAKRDGPAVPERETPQSEPPRFETTTQGSSTLLGPPISFDEAARITDQMLERARQNARQATAKAPPAPCCCQGNASCPARQG